MGEVYRATDTKLKRHVAIKILPGAVPSDADRLARFRREAEVLASLNHPNIAIYGFEDASGVHALVLEIVEGSTLEGLLAARALPLDDATRAQLPVEPRDGGQAPIHTLRSSPHMSLHRSPVV